MAEIKGIVVHISVTAHGSIPTLRAMHIERGWSDVGYHYGILNGRLMPDLYLLSLDGHVCIGRMMDGDKWVEKNEIGAHTLGLNSETIGVALIAKSGKDITENQTRSLCNLLYDLCKQYGLTPDDVLGHYETASGKEQGKTCPEIDMRAFREYLKLYFLTRDEEIKHGLPR